MCSPSDSNLFYPLCALSLCAPNMDDEKMLTFTICFYDTIAKYYSFLRDLFRIIRTKNIIANGCNLAQSAL